MVAAGEPGLIRYDESGLQTAVVARLGTGPNELRSPTIARQFGDTTIVWDSRNLKFVGYRESDTAAFEWDGFSEPAITLNR